MVGTSNIYVSVTQAVETQGRETGTGHTYRKPQHIWMLSIEPHHLRMPGLPHKHPEPVHYAATRNEDSGYYTIDTHSTASEPAIIGNILIVESAHTSAEQIHKILAESLGPSSFVRASEDASVDEPEQWIKKAIRALHEHKIGEAFNLDEFMMFAKGYEANRMDKEAPALIAYPKVHKDHEKKANKHGFWLSHPMAAHTKTYNNGEARLYGGLM